MRVLVACEFSGIVRDAFIAAGHVAMSCDLLPTERPGPHYQGDVREVLLGWPPEDERDEQPEADDRLNPQGICSGEYGQRDGRR